MDGHVWVFGVIAVISTLFKLDIARGYLAIAFPLGLFALSVNRSLARSTSQRSVAAAASRPPCSRSANPYRPRSSRSR